MALAKHHFSTVMLTLACIGTMSFFTPGRALAQDGEASEGTLEMIVVTARKREENVQDTPISITAFSAGDLAARQITNVGQLADATPNLTINTSASFSGSSSTPAIFLRGIGQVDFTLNTDPGVGLYVDGVYISRSVGGLIDLVDVQRVEVLRGPQGTLFGRNTIGGAINVTTTPPGDEFGGRIKATTGTDSRMLLQATVDVPLSETVKSRWSLNYHDRDGYVDRPLAGDQLGNDDSFSARGVIHFEPSETARIALYADYTTEDESAAPFILNAVNPGAGFAAFHNAVIAPMIDPSLALSDPMGPPSLCFIPTTNNPACFNAASLPVGQDGVNFGTLEAVSELDVFGVSVVGELDVGSATLKSITAYRDLESFSVSENDGAPVAINSTTDFFEYDQFSQELQLLGSGMDERLEWIVGAFYFSEEGDNVNLVNFAPIEIQSGGRVKNQSTAVFGQATWQITPRLELTAGLRWTEDERDFTPNQFIVNDIGGMGALNGVPLLPGVTASTDSSDVNPLLNLNYLVQDDLSLYVTYSEGFKSGGFTQRVFPPLAQTPDFEPETARTYEVGVKSMLADGRLRANAAIFLTDYEDLQVNVQRGIAPTTENAAAASISGFELEIQAAPIQGLRASLGIGYLDAEYDELDGSVVGLTLDSQLPGTSEWTVSSGLSYTHDLAAGGSLTGRADYSYRSEFFFDALNEVGENGYSVVNLGLTWMDAEDRWEASVFVDNVTDERYALQGTSILDPGGFQQLLLARPRQWGFSVSYSF
ncbi:MAG: TonB-dependent receptor [Lysobacterales bacterium]